MKFFQLLILLFISSYIIIQIKATRPTIPIPINEIDSEPILQDLDQKIDMDLNLEVYLAMYQEMASMGTFNDQDINNNNNLMFNV